MRSGKSAIAIVAALLITSCGAAAARPAGAGGPSASPTTGPAAGPAAGVSTGVAVRTPPTNGQRTLVADERDNGRAVSLRAGQRLEVVLSSTYWQVDGSSDPNVLRQTAQPTISPQLRGCVSGEGCGTVTADFDAVAPGRADVNAKRTSCGEAMSCTGNLGLYHVTVVVTA